MSYTQRNYPRIPLHVSALTITTPETVVQNAECVNISMGGMCIICNENVRKQGGTVEIMYENSEEVITFKAEFAVRWSRKGESKEKKRYFGLQFTYYSVEDLNKLVRIIVEQMKTVQCEAAA